MFEKFLSASAVVSIVQKDDARRLRKLISAGCRLDRRTTYVPRLTPLDAATISGNFECIKLLLTARVPVIGSSIYFAIKRDAVEILQFFSHYEKNFHRNFASDGEHESNPHLHRWLSCFTALDFATSIGSNRCAALLQKLNAQRSDKCKKHRSHCTAIYICERSFIVSQGINIDGQSLETSGFYCAKCDDFVGSLLNPDK